MFELGVEGSVGWCGMKGGWVGLWGVGLCRESSEFPKGHRAARCSTLLRYAAWCGATRRVAAWCGAAQSCAARCGTVLSVGFL